MARYVIANRRSGKFHETEKKAARAALSSAVSHIASGIQVVADNNPPDDRARRVMVVDADPADIQSMPGHPDVLVEPEILHWTDVNRPPDFVQSDRAKLAAPVPAGPVAIQVQVTGAGQPLHGALVLLFLRGPGQIERVLEQTTDATGRVGFSFSAFFQASGLVVAPAGGFWTMVVRAPAGNVLVDCLPLPATGPLGWWHQALDEREFDANSGNGIRVGVADTGCGPHPCLNHVVDVGAFLEGNRFPAPQGRDVDSHGSHVCGTISARPTTPGQFAGIAPGVDLFSARVFPPNQGASQADIANAIDELSRAHAVDLINLSLSSPQPSQIELDAVRDALERGTLCVCAAANSNGPVEFPAAFPECIAVSALGLLGFAPPGTLSSTRLPQDSGRFGDEGLFLANFSCFGSEVDCSGPGVAVIATVPERFGLVAPYAGMDGTSMASPSVGASLAVLLSASQEYRNLPRDITRARMARRILRRSCRDIDLAPIFQGRGVPTM